MTDLFITPDQLNRLTGLDIAIFDCRFSLADHALGRQQYENGHIPGASHLDMELNLSGPKHAHGGRHPLPSAASFTTLMQNSGVSINTRVIAYDNNRLAGAARLWWLLQHFGHSQVSILDGGINTWEQQGLPLSQHELQPEKGDFRAIPDTTELVDYHWLSGNLGNPGLQLVDSREGPRYQGLEEPIDPFAGHIPGALNYPWQEVTRDDGKVQDNETQAARWQQLDQTKETVVYCGSGVTACVNLLSLVLSGHVKAKLYAGSWSDWCSYTDSVKKP